MEGRKRKKNEISKESALVQALNNCSDDDDNGDGGYSVLASSVGQMLYICYL